MTALFRNAQIMGKGVAYADYARQTAKRGEQGYVMSRGDLVEFDRCPRRWLLGASDDEDTVATEWGNLVEIILMDKAHMFDRIAVHPETYPAEPKRKGDPVEHKPWNWNATFCKEWREKTGGKLVVSPKHFDEAGAAVERLSDDEHISALVSASDTQVMVTGEYHDPATGVVVPCRGLLDWYPQAPFAAFLADLKTCQSAEPRAWGRTVFQRGYHIQAALYLDLCNAATGEDRREFLHVLQESSSPFETGRRELSAAYIANGRNVYRNALVKYCACLKENRWPGYDDDSPLVWSMVEPEPWMFMAQGSEAWRSDETVNEKLDRVMGPVPVEARGEA